MVLHKPPVMPVLVHDIGEIWRDAQIVRDHPFARVSLTVRCAFGGGWGVSTAVGDLVVAVVGLVVVVFASVTGSLGLWHGRGR